jgi:hypothetical protein
VVGGVNVADISFATRHVAGHTIVLAAFPATLFLGQTAGALLLMAAQALTAEIGVAFSRSGLLVGIMAGNAAEAASARPKAPA